MENGETVRMELDEVRPPSDDERRLMDALVTSAHEPLLSEQVRTAVVHAVCRCGCSSVRLRSDGPAIPSARVAQLSERGRDDHMSVRASSAEPAQEMVHVVHGLLEELEVYDARGGDGVAVALAEITGLGPVTVT